MADQDELYYLQPDFDISTLTIPKIRSILVAHDVPYGSSAKKQELLDILQQQVIPKSRKLLSAQARVKRTSRGITDVPSSQEELDEDDEAAQRMPPPPAPKTPRSRKSKSSLPEETPRTARKSRTPSRRRSTKVRQSEDAELTVERPIQDEVAYSMNSAAARSGNQKAAVFPVNRFSLMTEEEKKKYLMDSSEPAYRQSRRSPTLGESPFSDDNPFQSGSSPPTTSKRISSGSKSKSSVGGKRKSTSSPEIKREDAEHYRSTYEIPVSRIGIDRNGVEATEEFTEEAEHELKQELSSNRQLARSRNSALVRHQKQPVSTAVKTAPFVVLTSVLAALGGWYRQEKINVGYCGVGDVNWSLISNPNIPSWAHENLQPQCEPCPQHAICYPKMEVKCEENFVLLQHPLSLNGLVPIVPTCEPDSEKERKIKAVADKAVEELRERKAAFECGDESTSISPETTEPVKLEIPEETLKQQVSKMRRKGMTEEEFNDLWRGAVDDIINRDEIEVVRDGVPITDVADLEDFPSTVPPSQTSPSSVPSEDRLSKRFREIESLFQF